MTHKLLGIAIATVFTFGLSQSAQAGGRGFARVSPRTVNSFQRDVRQFQRQSGRTFNQIGRNVNRGVRRSPVRYAPRSSGVYLGGARGGVYFRF